MWLLAGSVVSGLRYQFSLWSHRLKSAQYVRSTGAHRMKHAMQRGLRLLCLQSPLVEARRSQF